MRSLLRPGGPGFNCCVSMPFRTAARISIANESAKDLIHFVYDIQFSLDVQHTPETLYFHSHWRRESPNELGRGFHLPAEGGRTPGRLEVDARARAGARFPGPGRRPGHRTRPRDRAAALQDGHAVDECPLPIRLAGNHRNRKSFRSASVLKRRNTGTGGRLRWLRRRTPMSRSPHWRCAPRNLGISALLESRSGSSWAYGRAARPIITSTAASSAPPYDRRWKGDRSRRRTLPHCHARPCHPTRRRAPRD